MRTILQYQPICTTAGNNNSNNYIYKEKYFESIFQSLPETARHIGLLTYHFVCFHNYLVGFYRFIFSFLQFNFKNPAYRENAL